MFHVRTLIAVVALASLAGPGQAQQPAQGQQPAQAQQSAPKTPAHLEAARVVVVASGISRSFDAMIPGFVQQVRRVTVTRPDLAKDLEEVIAKVSPEFEKTKQELIEAAARVYAERLSEAELKERRRVLQLGVRQALRGRAASRHQRHVRASRGLEPEDLRGTGRAHPRRDARTRQAVLNGRRARVGARSRWTSALRRRVPLPA